MICSMCCAKSQRMWCINLFPSIPMRASDALPQMTSVFSLNKPVLSANPRRGKSEGFKICKIKFSIIIA